MMTAQVSIVLARRPQVLGIPATALGARGADGRYAVRVLDADGKPEERRVRIGLNTNVVAEVRDGLREGEMVVIGEGSANPAPTQMRRMRPPPV
jgi:macrolide-specific efflux system membrane fusion protein